MLFSVCYKRLDDINVSWHVPLFPRYKQASVWTHDPRACWRRAIATSQFKCPEGLGRLFLRACSRPWLWWSMSFPAQRHFSGWNWILPRGDWRYADISLQYHIPMRKSPFNRRQFRGIQRPTVQYTRCLPGGGLRQKAAGSQPDSGGPPKICPSPLDGQTEALWGPRAVQCFTK